jgi:putative RecB family exonuclease
LPSELETIEAFLGSRVHEALKEFYDFIKNRVVKPKEWLLSRYEDLWHKNYNDSIKIVKKELSADDYHQKGKKCLLDYYDEYFPFDQTKIVKTEERISFTLRQNEEEYPFSGILDRLDWNDREKVFEIHDYKTSSILMTQEEADRDIQLPLYQIAVQSRWPEAEKAKLIWHFLLFNKKIESSRTKEELNTLQEIVVNKINVIEVSSEFPPTQSALCDWCDFQEICPLWKHPIKMEALELNEYRRDPGVVLVSKHSELEERKQELKQKIFEIEEEQAKIEEAAIEFAEREGIRTIDGPDHQLVITVKDELCAPTRKENTEMWEKLREFLIRENKYIDVSTVNNQMLNRMLRIWPAEIMEKIRNFFLRKVIKKAELRKKI